MPSSVPKLLVPDHISYLLANGALEIVTFSAPVVQYAIEPDQMAIATDLRDSFPELYGLEETFADILAGNQAQFAVKAINRTTETGETVYLDLYFRRDDGTGDTESLLLMFVENVTDKMALEQTLVQNNNETNLLMVALENAKQYANTIIESMAEALIVTDLEGFIVRVNAATEEILGYSPAELQGSSLFDLLDTEDARLLQYQAIDFATYPHTNQRLELNCRNKQGDMIILAFSCALVEQQSRPAELIYVGRDVTRDRRDQERLAVQYMVARTLSEASSIEQVTQHVLQIICNQLRFVVGELWTPISRSEVNGLHFPAVKWNPTSRFYLQRIHQVSSLDPNPETDSPNFIQVGDRILLTPGTGLAGRVWEQRTPQWIYDLSQDSDFGQQSFACQEGLSSAFAFPITSEREMLGVMTFFTRDRQTHDPDLLQIMDSIGQQLGQYIRRKQMENALKQQQQQTESLLLNILPETIATQLRQSGRTIARQFDNATVLFADLVGFTEFAAQLSPIEVVEILNEIFSCFDQLTETYQLEKIKTIGDSYMVVGGLPEPRPDHAQAIAEMALDMRAVLETFNAQTKNDLKIRIGIHSGTVVAGVIGQKKFIYDLWGDTVNTASRMESHGVPNKIQCSRFTYEELCDLNYHWEERGCISVKGKGDMKTYFLQGRQ